MFFRASGFFEDFQCMTVVQSYRELIVWQKAVALVVEIYSITACFPSEERYGLISQMRRSAISLPSNIAEGRCRGTQKDFLHFLRIAYGSGAELETQLEIALRLNFLSREQYQKSLPLIGEVMKMLNVMIRRLGG